MKAGERELYTYSRMYDAPVIPPFPTLLLSPHPSRVLLFVFPDGESRALRSTSRVILSLIDMHGLPLLNFHFRKAALIVIPAFLRDARQVIDSVG